MSNVAGTLLRARTRRERSIAFTLLIFTACVVEWLSSSAHADDRTQAILERIPRNRPAAVAARKVAEALGPNADSEAVRLAQLVLDLNADWFGDDLTSLHLAVEKRLRDCPDSVFRKYEALVGGDAGNAVQDADSTEKLRLICRRYFLTSAGYTASERLIASWLDAGEYELAARLADQVLAEPAHRPRISPQFGSLVASLKQIEGSERDAPANERAVHFHRQFLKNRRALILGESGWNLLGGDAKHNRIIQGSPPIPATFWSADFFQHQNSASVQEFLKDWEGARKEVDQPICPAVFPIVVDGHVIFRDSAGLRSLNATTGKPSWYFPCHYSPMTASSRNELLARRRMGIQGGQNALGENSLMGSVSSDGRCVFAIDATAVGDNYVEYQDSGLYMRQYRNRLVAVYVAEERKGQLAWVNDGQLPDRLKKAGSPTYLTFLGPPLPGTTELLCVTEQDDEVHLTGINSQSGETTWSQPLCTIERLEQHDPERHEMACLPARANGVVVCPTNTGMLVAVDQVRLNLLWAAFVDEPPDLKRVQGRSNIRTPSHGYAGYASHLMISDGKVVYLPPRSNQLHCLDLATGKSLWAIPRGDAEFVGALSHNRVLVVGRLGCRSLGLDDGREMWATATGLPAGCGVAIGDRYALPLDGGRLALIDMKTGRDHWANSLHSDFELGHLVADADRVYSLSPRALVAFPQVHHVLANVDPVTPGDRYRREILQAEANMVQGNLREATRQLQILLDRDLSPVDQQRARRDLKELLFERLLEEANVAQADLELLDRMLDSPAEQFRFLITVGTKASFPALEKQWADRAFELPTETTGYAVAGNDEWVISPAVWCRLQIHDHQPSGIGKHLREHIFDPVTRLQHKPVPAWMQHIEVFDGDARVDSTRLQLAGRFRMAGVIHSAETLLLRNRSSKDPKVAADAAVRLMELWEGAGFVADAGRQLDALATEFAGTRLDDGQTGAQFVKRLDANHPVKRAWRQSRPPIWSVDHVEIRQTTVAPEFAERNLPAPSSSREPVSFQLERQDIGPPGRYFRAAGQAVEFVTSPANHEDQYLLSVFDQRTKLRLGSLTIPQAYRPATADKLVSGGHLLPLGVPGGIMGISMLQLGDSEPAWQHFPADLAGRKSTVFPGPSGSNFLSYQWRNRLYVVDPVNGNLLWQRIIPVMSQDTRLDLIGDQQALAVQIPERAVSQNSDRKLSYEVFETSTGRKLSTVRTGYIPNQWQGYYGRFVMGFAETPDGRRLQIRDLLKDVPDVSEVVSDSSRQPILQGGELVYLGPGGDIKIFDIAQCRKTLSVQLEAAELLPVGVVRLLSDRSRYFLNLQRHTPTATTAHFNQPINNSQLPGFSVRDDIYAFDRATGELLWKRSIPYRTVLQFTDCDMPFLVTVSIVKDRVNNARQSLTIEVIDSSTGATIGYRENLTFENSDHLLTASYDGETGRILLRGQASDIELRFGPAEGQTQAGP